MDPWELISPKEQDGVPAASTEDLVAWRSEWVSDAKYADPKFKGYKAIMADLVAYLISFTDAFDALKTPQGVVSKFEIGVAMKQPIAGSNQMVLETDTESPIRAMMLELPKMPEGQDNVTVEDTLGLLERATASTSSAA